MGKLLVRRERMRWCLYPENFVSSCTLERRKMPFFKSVGGDLDHYDPKICFSGSVKTYCVNA